MTNLSIAARFVCRPVASLTREVTPGAFLTGRDVRVCVAPKMAIPMPKPAAMNVSVDELSIQRPAGMPISDPGFPSIIDVPPMSIARLSNVVCLPGGVLIAEPDIVIEDTFSAPWEREFHHHLRKLTGGEYSLKRVHEEPKALAGQFMCLDYQHYMHYGHFLVDVLSRIWGYDYTFNYFGLQDIKLLVAEGEAPFADDLLHLYGIPEHKIVRLSGPVRVQELIVATKSFQIQEFTSPVASGIWRKVGNAARRSGCPDRVYVSRIRNPQRPLINEAEVEALLSSKGFSILRPEEVPTSEQITIFASAGLIVGTSGSNVFNLAFQQCLRAALVIVSPALIHYTDMFLQFGGRYELSYYLGAAAEHHPGYQPLNVHSPWQIDMSAFAGHLDTWLRGNHV